MERAYVIHRAPGRARLKIPERRNDRRFFAELAERMTGCAGVERIEANPTTGSVLVMHAGEFEPILEFAREQRIFAPAEPDAGQPTIAQRLRGEFRAMDGALRRSTDGQIDISMAVFLLLVAASVVQLFRGRVFGPASTLLLSASSLLAARGAPGESGEGAGEDE